MRCAKLGLVLVLALSVAACDKSGDDDGSGTGTEPPGTGATQAGCVAAASQLVYLIDAENNLVAFSPTRLGAADGPFKPIAQLDCPTTSAVAQFPFSMSVDRTGKGWVVYRSGEMFQVEVLSATCSKSSYKAAAGLTVFGMGFVKNDGDGADETLFVASASKLAAINPTATEPTPVDVGPFATARQRSPELTGTGDGKLYGFFPEGNAPFVQEIDKRTGALLGTPMMIEGTLAGSVTAWAFAHFGGKFYVFLTTTGGFGDSTLLHIFDRATGSYVRSNVQVPYKIVGAGVSTCAPIKIE